MSILNEDSGSLIIAEGRHEIEIDSSGERPPKEDDLFELSRDDPTLSFHIEEEKKQQIFIDILEPSHSVSPDSVSQLQDQGENKKRRKEIFQKFKRPQTSIASKVDSIHADDHLLNIFDSIFNTKVSQPNPTSNRDSKVDNNLLRPQTQVIRSKTPSSEKRERLKIFAKKHYSKQYQEILPSGLQQSAVSQVTVLPIESQRGSPILKKTSTDSINFSIIENRLSGIMVQEAMDYSREEQEIKCFLESEIFRDQQEVKQPQRIETLQSFTKVITSIDKLEIEKEEAIRHSIEPSPQKQQVMLSARLPAVPPRGRQVQLEESRVLRNDTSIISNAPVLIEAYDSAGTFRPENSMANIISPPIGDLTLKGRDNNLDNDKNPSLIQSQIVQIRPPLIRVNSVFQSEARMPKFLREIRKHISIYPNFYAFHTSNSIEAIGQQFSHLLDLFSEAIRILSDLCQTVLDLKSKKNLYLSELANSSTEEFFLESGWERLLKVEDFEIIKPIQPFECREWSYEKARTALKNYENIVEYYRSRGIRLDIEQEKGKKKYFQIRQKFWDICGNMKLISEDIYTQMIDCHFPPHFHTFLSLLAQPLPNRMQQHTVARLQEMRLLFKALQGQNDLLISSHIGVKIKARLDLMSKYLMVY